MLQCRGPQPGVHVPLGVHLPIRRRTFKVSNREVFICISFLLKYLYIYQWILFSKAVALNMFLANHDTIFCHKEFQGYMFIWRNAEGVHGQRKVGNPCSNAMVPNQKGIPAQRGISFVQGRNFHSVLSFFFEVGIGSFNTFYDFLFVRTKQNFSLAANFWGIRLLCAFILLRWLKLASISIFHS